MEAAQSFGCQDQNSQQIKDSICSEVKSWKSWAYVWFAVAAVCVSAIVFHLAAEALMPRGEKPTVSSIVTGILLRKKVPADNTIIKMVRFHTGNDKFDKNDLAWYKTKVRQGKTKGQDGIPHVITQRVARYRDLGRFGGMRET